jgi:hypothetical protein
MQELGVKLNNLNTSFFGPLNVEERALNTVVSFYRRFTHKCLADPKVRARKQRDRIRNQ